MCNLISLLKYQIQIPEAALQSIPPCHFSATCDRQLIRLLSRHGKILHRYQLWSTLPQALHVQGHQDQALLAT